MVTPHGINTKDPAAVAEAARDVFAKIDAKESWSLLSRLISDVTRMFWGQYPGLRAIDMKYHDFEHTLQATVCVLHLLEGRHRVGARPPLSRRDGEIAVAAVLLHDTGYLKSVEDPEGTGAKYTLVHVQRSCEFAASYLPSLGFNPGEIEDVMHAISCTGPVNKFGTVPFRRPESRVIACMLVTADYLGQMSAPDYVDELPILFREFQEAYAYAEIPPEKQTFKSEKQLIEKTPDFWEKYVRPMLATDAGGVIRFLEQPDGTNPYLEAVEANIAEVRQRVASRAPVG